jgi:hypothetical protein
MPSAIALSPGSHSADIESLGVQERIGHSAADDQLVDMFHQVFQNRNFCRNLGSPDHGADGP